MAHHRRSIPGIIFSAFFGLLVFFLIVLGFNYAAANTGIEIIDFMADFLNQNMLLIVLMSLLFLAADLLRAMIFPLNLPSPFFSAAACVFLVEFLMRIFGLAERLAGEAIFDAFRPLVPLIYFLVFFAVLIGGYISIFSELFNVCNGNRKDEKIEKKEGPFDDHSWEDVGKEFRNMMYEAFHNAKEDMKKD